jgi:hypothetical protein
MRGLSTQFLDDLQQGVLAPLRNRVAADRSLCLEIRDNCVNIYYRGGNLMRISQTPGGYDLFFDPEYAKLKAGGRPLPTLPTGKVTQPKDTDAWLACLPTLVQTMDLWFGENPKEECEIQQIIVRDNNFGSIGRSTDYYFCDIEYAYQRDRFDMVAVHWPSTPAKRRQARGRRLVLVEVKHGDGAVGGKSGIDKHIKGINAFLADAPAVRKMKDEMVASFNDKRALGLVDCGKDLAGFSDEPPLLMLLLVNHDPEKTALGKVLANLPPSPLAEIRIATSSFMGYGLYDPAIYTVAEVKSRFPDIVYSGTS